MALSTTKDRIVELSRNAIQSLGYHSFNYRQIADELKIKNAAIHHYFPAKEDLGVAVVEKDLEDFKGMITRLGSAAPSKRIEAFLKAYAGYFENGQKLCVIGTFCSTYSSIPEKIATVSKTYMDTLTSWLTATFREGLDSGEFNFSIPVEDMVNLWVTALPGTLQTGRVRGSRKFYQSLHSLKKLLKQE
ncbi:MAG: TetR/AcrR family transcriptional regulator [Pseudobacter sp.]|uniref:TetR/AcrR family transcriptional regulator n=1 Tax=Pseudobacter sp. TaxID=2045420 RepID=UPI003F7DB341